MSNGTLFTRLPGWLREALAAQEPDVPNHLGGVVDPVLDVGQGGWGTMVWTHEFMVAANNTNIVDIVAASADVGILVVGVDVDNTGSAVNTDAQLLAVTPSGLSVRLWRRSAVAAGLYSAYNMEDSGGVTRMGQGSIIIPPGFGLRGILGTIGVGSSSTMNMIVGRFRAGYKPI